MDISIYLQVLLQQPDGWWKHHLRTQIRFAFWEQASRTRKDSVGMHAGLDYEASSRPGRSKIFHCRYLPRELNLLRRFLVGSTPTRVRLHKAKRAQSSKCRCGHPYVDVEHIIHYCRLWQQSRQELIDNTSEAERHSWPACLAVLCHRR